MGEEHQTRLCGFLRLLLSARSLAQENPQNQQSPSLGVSCSLSGGKAKTALVSDDGFILSPIEDVEEDTHQEEEPGSPNPRERKKKSFYSKRKRRRKGRTTTTVYSACKRKKGPVGGEKVVNQLVALTRQKLISIECRVIGGALQGDVVRAVVLVDVYLPKEAWCGWQFPRSGSVAASLFRHLSCNWEMRGSLLDFQSSMNHMLHDNESVRSDSDCSVIGCSLQHRSPDKYGKRKSFDLHEIFKTLPSVVNEDSFNQTRINPENTCTNSGIWDLADDVLSNILCTLTPRDLVSVASACRHLRSLAASIMPSMNLKLFPHQNAAIKWMLKRERNSEVLPHPLYMDFSTPEGFQIYMNVFSGNIVANIAPTVKDFNGGMFCDEPGLGKTITALSLILKTSGMLAEPPKGADVVWCMHGSVNKCGYYEVSSEHFVDASNTVWKRFSPNSRRRKNHDDFSNSCMQLSKSENSAKCAPSPLSGLSEKSLKLEMSYKTMPKSLGKRSVSQQARDLSCVRRNLLNTYGGITDFKSYENTKHAKFHHNGQKQKKRSRVCSAAESNESWVQCDACRKWRKLPESTLPDATSAWFCSMNRDPLYKACTDPEESWDHTETITYMPGFHIKGTSDGTEENISFFTTVLREHSTLIHSESRKALDWLADLSDSKLLEMETSGLTSPVLDTHSHRDANEYHKIFQALGLVRKIFRGTTRWYYPQKLENLVFDVKALQIALTKPVDLFRFYLSRATLIVVPANLVDHWKTQVQRHVQAGQLRVFLWNDHKKPTVHSLAWDYDIVLTTFNRLSVEWGSWRRSALMQVHWLRVILDEGHTLGSSLSLTNKLQMAISITASYRWILTGTPTPNTPNSHVAHLHPMLKFLHEEAYGQSQESWDNGILKPFELEIEDGRLRLVQLLQRIMISARKSDLKTIPPCIKKATFLDFTREHGRSYNELVVTVRRNILLADWNDPSHVESLLNPKQWKLRSDTIRNVRLSCCVAGHIKVTDAGEDIQETMDVLAQMGLDPLSEEYGSIRTVLLNGDNCLRCGNWCRLPIITPCRHILCLDCVSLNCEKCTFPGCGNPYEMQRPELLARPENPNPKWPVPKDLIELQPSYKQDNWNPDWHATSSSKVAYLIDRLKELRDAGRKLSYSREDEDECYHRMTASYRHDGESNCLGPQKVIIFSQFLEHIHVIEQQMTIAGITFAGMYNPMHMSNKMKSLAVFQNDANCLALLMDGSAALGLDLSFATHVFLMEPIWDRSMEEQVISRAHRMGAVRPIHVETLAMRGTIEEQMMDFLQNSEVWRNVLKQSDYDSRAHRSLHDFAGSNYLTQLSSVKVKGD